MEQIERTLSRVYIRMNELIHDCLFNFLLFFHGDTYICLYVSSTAFGPQDPQSHHER